MIIIHKSFVDFPVFKQFSDILIHGFSTRTGGVSPNPYNTLNLGLKNKDSSENVDRNYEILLNELQLNRDDMVFANQVHGDNSEVVFDKPAGGGRIINYCDALITNRSGIALTGFFADCVPVFIFDCRMKIAAVIHSGWKGTAKDITGKTVDKLLFLFGSDPKDLYCAIGPSIGDCCFETDRNVFDIFNRDIKWSTKHITQKSNGKYNINLKFIIRDTLLQRGIKLQNMFISPVCTKCNKDLFFSYRGDNGKTGSMVGIIQIK